jgi:hypothetical protein
MLKVPKSVTREKGDGPQRSLLRTSQSSHQVTAQFQSRRSLFTQTAAQTFECARAEGFLRSPQTEGRAEVRGNRMDSTWMSTYPLGKTRCSPTEVLSFPSRYPGWATPSFYRSELESAVIKPMHGTCDGGLLRPSRRTVHVICPPNPLKSVNHFGPFPTVSFSLLLTPSGWNTSYSRSDPSVLGGRLRVD